MKYRKLGNTGLTVSEIGFGTGAIGGLMIKGEPRERVRVVARALELGVTYIDTAEAYGGGHSEENLGKVLAELKPEIVLGTKVMLREHQMDDIKGTVMASMEASLKRLQRESVDVIQLHNSLTPEGTQNDNWLTPSQAGEAIEAMQEIVAQGKARHWGLNGLGDPATVKEMVTTSGAQTVQSVFNLLNPSSGYAVPEGFPFEEYDELIPAAKEAGVGVFAIRVLAGGALTGSVARHPVGTDWVNPIGTSDLATDVKNANRFLFMVEEGIVESLVEAATRFDLSQPCVSTAMVGASEMSHVEQAVAFAEKGPLPQEAFDRFEEIWASLEA